MGFFSKEREEEKQGRWRYIMQRNTVTPLFPLATIAAMSRQIMNRRLAVGAGGAARRLGGFTPAGIHGAAEQRAGEEGNRMNVHCTVYRGSTTN